MAVETQDVHACKPGDRQAFAGVVERYHRLVCAVAYSATGDLALSEDICQETFLTAWRKLDELREPERLRPWLCGIARNLARNATRSRSARPGDHMPLTAAQEAPSPAPGPERQAITSEEAALLWRSLGQIPNDYREPLVLFYRQEKSVAEVAEAMGLSEEAVRQRLSRGRKMLEERLAIFVESALHRSTPSRTLAIAIIAALPAAGPHVAAAGVASVATKGSAAAQAAGMTWLLGAILGPLLGLLGAYIGVRASLANARSSRERAYLIRLTWICAGLVAIFVAAMILFPLYIASALSPAGIAIGIIALIVTYSIALVTLIMHGNRRIRRIQQEDGTYVEPSLPPEGMGRSAILGSLGGGIFGGIAWLLALAFMSRDWLALGIVLAGASLIFAAAATIAIRNPHRYFRIAAVAMALVGLLDLLVLNLRWTILEAAAQAQPLPFMRTPGTPLWLLNAIIGLMVAALVVLMLVKDRAMHRRENDTTGHDGPVRS